MFRFSKIVAKLEPSLRRYDLGMIGQIELTDGEMAMYAEISEADRLLLVNHDAQRARQAGNASKKLFRSLFERGAIPESRLRYFADPEYNAHNSRTSRRELFPQASKKLLIQHLRQMEQDGLIIRTDLSKKIPHVEYSLSNSIDRAVVHLIDFLAGWGAQHSAPNRGANVFGK